MKLPASGEWTTPLRRRRPSWTGEIEMLEAPMSITRAEALPAEKLRGGGLESASETGR